jgi:hypothetical protein
METNKWCPKCQQDLSQDLFYHNRAQADGLAPIVRSAGLPFAVGVMLAYVLAFQTSGALKWSLFAMITFIL